MRKAHAHTTLNTTIRCTTDNIHRSIFHFTLRRESSGWNSSLRVAFVITVPEQYNLDIDTSGGALTVANVIGNVQLKTSH